MTKPVKQFDPQTMFDQTLAELDMQIQAARASVDRLEWLRGKLKSEFEAMQDAADTFELFTEEQAAMMLQVKPEHLGTLRRSHDLPHVNFGNKIRYTKNQLNAICSELTINSKGKAALKRAA